MTNPAQVNFLEKKGDRAWVSLRMRRKGGYHQVRKMFEAIGPPRDQASPGWPSVPLELSGIEPGNGATRRRRK
jgi:hypothetical protein